MRSELSKQLHQLIQFLMILVHVEQKSDFRVILYNRTITFICFNNQPFSTIISCISNFALLNQSCESGPTNN